MTEKKTERERLGISDETMQSMREFFMKHSVPKLIELKENDPEEYERFIKGK